jgi:hypothetical protein
VDRTLRPKSGHWIIQPFNFDARDTLEISDELATARGLAGRPCDEAVEKQAHEKPALPYSAW